MKKLPFERPTDHYEEKIFSIDEQICELVQKRKELSGNNPGFPPAEYIQDWAKKYGLYEDLLNALFGTLRTDEHFRIQVEPSGFQKYIPVLKSVVKGDSLYSVTFIRQYENASVVNFNIDWDESEDSSDSFIRYHHFWELYINEDYYCTMDGGGGSGEHINNNFVVSPRLPDDVSGLQLIFKENEEPFESPTGVEIVIDLD